MTSIAVIFNGEEVQMTGLTSRTTCGDLIYALLIADGNVNGHEWAIFEKWKDVERRLPDRAKITKVWKSWRSEQQNVRFVLQKTDLRHVRKSRGSRHSRRHRNQKVVEEYTVQELTMQIMEQQKVIVEQMQRMGELDHEIDQRETDLHYRRASEDGNDYVQQAYRDDIDKKCPDIADLSINEREQYMGWCEKILDLGEKLMQEEQKLQDLSLELSILEPEDENEEPQPKPAVPQKVKHVSFSDDVRALSPIAFELPESRFDDDKDSVYSGCYNVTSGTCRMRTSTSVHSDPWGTYVILRNGNKPAESKNTCDDDSFENNSSESGNYSDQDQYVRDDVRKTQNNVRPLSWTNENELDLKSQNRKACERWCQQFEANYHSAANYNEEEKLTIGKNLPGFAHGSAVHTKDHMASRYNEDAREDSYLNYPPPNEIFAELNAGFSGKHTRLSDNDSDTGLSSMHSSDMSVLETLV